MDEVFIIGSEFCPRCKGQDPAKLFAKAVTDLHDHLKGRGAEMLMWGDRLVDGKATGLGEWEASTNGTAPAVDLIPKDVIVCPWHYTKRAEYPSIPMLLGKGFRVLPAGWDKPDAVDALIDFSQAQKNPRMLGYMATNWSTEHQEDRRVRADDPRHGADGRRQTAGAVDETFSSKFAVGLRPTAKERQCASLTASLRGAGGKADGDRYGIPDTPQSLRPYQS